jgi:hypothetical protein
MHQFEDILVMVRNASRANSLQQGMDAQDAGSCIVIIFSQILSKFYLSP